MSNKPPKPAYWEKRAEQKEKYIQGHTTQAVRQIAKTYDKANGDIKNEIRKVFETYKNDSGLTDNMAMQLLNNTEKKELIQYLKYKMNTIADERIRKDILNRINAVSYAARITRLEALSERVGAVFKQTADIELGTDKSVLGNAYKESYYRTMFDCQQGFGIGADFALIPEKALKTVLESKFMGKNFSERVWTNTNALAKKLKTVLSAGIATGASIEKMSNDIADLSLQGKMMATRLIRTETTFYMGQGELKAYAEFGIDKYKYLATLDSRTSPMCAELDGGVFNVADAVPGENYPPLHAWCRSTTIAYFGDEDTGTRIARDKDGKTYKVPSDMTYAQWKEKYVANDGNSDIIDVGSDSVALENQRYGRNKNTIVNKTYIESGEYRRKFDKISSNSRVNREVYNRAKEALKHRSGTVLEDMYWIDGDTGKVVAQEINSSAERMIIYSEATRSVVEKNKNLIALHTHPSSMPPSIADFNSCCRNGYKCGYIACHDGKLYAYTSNQIVNGKLYELYIESFIKEGFSEFDSQIKALEKLKENYLIDFWEVT